MAAPANTGPFTTMGNFDKVGTTQENIPLGTKAYGPNGKAFRYVQFLDAVAYAAGQVVTLAGGTIDTWKVSNDRAGGSADVGTFGHVVRGVCPAWTDVPTQNQFGWIQVEGECVVLGTYVAGDYLIPHATTDGQAVVSGYTAAKANFNIFAKALSTTVAVLTGVG